MQILTHSLLLLSNFLFLTFGQTFYEIKYTYSQTLEIDDDMRRAYPPEILEQIREASNLSYEFLLYTNEQESIIKLQPKVMNTQSELGLEIEPDLKWAYKNLNENYIVNLIVFNKKYYVKDSLQNLNWQKTNEQKEILGHQTQKYFYEDENQIIEIWCANEIEIPNGPLSFRGNENLILESTISNKNGANLSYHFIATEINHPVEYNLKKEMPEKIINKPDFEKIFSDYKKTEKEMHEGIDKD